MTFLKNKYTVLCHEPTEIHKTLPMLHLWNYPTLSEGEGSTYTKSSKFQSVIQSLIEDILMC